MDNLKLPMKRLNLHIPEALHRAIRQEALQANVSMKRYVLRAVVEKLQREKSDELA